MRAEHGPLRLQLAPGPENEHEKLLAVGHEASTLLERAGIRHLAGGGVAVWAYGRFRMTKDIDLFLPYRMQGQAMDVLARAGFHTRETDALWLYKAIKDGVVIDLITYTTGDIRLEDETFAYMRRQQVDGYEFPLMGPEDMVFRKIHSTDETRFHDWYDALAIIARRGATDFDWGYFERLVRTRPLERVVALLCFAAADPGMRGRFPEALLQGLMAASRVCASSNTA